jgi:delta-aminolevulinic acid dehydratase/porphobilinogen synthase
MGTAALHGERVDNDATLGEPGPAVVCCRSRADVIAPDMMDGQWRDPRGADGAGFADLPILAYAVKLASGLALSVRLPSRPPSATGYRTRWTRPPTRGDARGRADASRGPTG